MTFNFPINVDASGRTGIGIGGPGGIAVDLDSGKVGAAAAGVAIFPDDGIKRRPEPTPLVKTEQTEARIEGVRQAPDLKSALRLIEAMPELKAHRTHPIVQRQGPTKVRGIFACDGRLYLQSGKEYARINVDKLGWLTGRLDDVGIKRVTQLLPGLLPEELANGLTQLFATAAMQT